MRRKPTSRVLTTLTGSSSSVQKGKRGRNNLLFQSKKRSLQQISSSSKSRTIYYKLISGNLVRKSSRSNRSATRDALLRNDRASVVFVPP